MKLSPICEASSRVEEEIVDFIVVTTGFNNPVERLYGDFMNPRTASSSPMSAQKFVETSPNLRIVRGFEPSLGQVGFARQVVSPERNLEDIYLVGPLAGNIVDARELQDIDENSVANANHNWRVWRFIEALALRLTGSPDFVR